MVAFPNAEPDRDRHAPLLSSESATERHSENSETTLAAPPEPQSLQPVQTWASPPEPINQMLDAPATPTVIVSPDRQWLVTLTLPALPTIAELAEPEIPVAGFRLNPRTNAPARHRTYRGMELTAVRSGISKAIPLPENPQISYLRWSPNGQCLAFALTQSTGLELWWLTLAEGVPHRLTTPVLNATLWYPVPLAF